MANRSNIYIDQGTDFNIELDILSDESEPVDITDYIFESKAKKIYSSSGGFSFNCLKTNSANGNISIILYSNTSVSLEPGKYQYDLLMTDSSNERTKILEGLVFILETNTV